MCRRPVCQRDGQAGFTLLELVVVIGAIAVVMSVLTLGVRSARDAFSMRRAATIVMSELRRAHAEATAEGVDYIVEFDVVTGSGTSTGLKIYKDSVSTPVRVIGPQEWPSNIQMLDGLTKFPACPSPPADSSNDCAVFKPLGYAAASGGVRLKLKSASVAAIEIEVTSATGRVNITRL